MEALVERLRGNFAECDVAVARDDADAMRDVDGAVNATPIGMDGHEGIAFDAGLLRREMWVAEVIYFPRETELLRRARALGCRTVDGAAMAVHQAARAFELFTGRAADAERMRGVFDAGR